MTFNFFVCGKVNISLDMALGKTTKNINPLVFSGENQCMPGFFMRCVQCGVMVNVGEYTD